MLTCIYTYKIFLETSRIKNTVCTTEERTQAMSAILEEETSRLSHIGHLFLIIIDIFMLMSFWLVYMETCCIYFLTSSFVIYICKHHHHHREIEIYCSL
jgi:hypothetical protein